MPMCVDTKDNVKILINSLSHMLYYIALHTIIPIINLIDMTSSIEVQILITMLCLIDMTSSVEVHILIIIMSLLNIPSFIDTSCISEKNGTSIRHVMIIKISTFI